MKKKLLILIIGILFYSCSSSNIKPDTIKYFDENNNEISNTNFAQLQSANYKTIDSLHKIKSPLREKRGKINNRPLLESFLEKEIGQKIDSKKPIVIIYYPGKDACNSGQTSKKWIKKWYKQLEHGLNKIAQVKPIYIFKDSDGLKKYNGIVAWKKDPEKTIERLFFKKHYPCSSFVVISNKGNYISYFGEFGKEYVWEATELMNN